MTTMYIYFLRTDHMDDLSSWRWWMDDFGSWSWRV